MELYPKNGISAERLKGTKTEENLHTALSGESQAYLRYRWFEKKAKQDGFVDISRIFAETADNEKEHAELWFKYLGDGPLQRRTWRRRQTASILSGRACTRILPRRQGARALTR